MGLSWVSIGWALCLNNERIFSMKPWVAFILGMIVASTFFAIPLAMSSYENGYKLGLGDAASGSARYKLVKQRNGETVYESCCR